MPRFARAGLLTALLLALQAGPARTYAGGWAYAVPSYPAYYSAYYPAWSFAVPAPVAYYPPVWTVSYAAPAPLVCAPTFAAVPVVAAPAYAVPTPAPPSRTPQPPAVKLSTSPNLTVIESQNRAGGQPGRASGLVRVGFWNVSGRDLQLTVEGRPQTLPRNRSVTLDLPRRFAWRVDARPAQTESVPENNSTLEIVLRR